MKNSPMTRWALLIMFAAATPVLAFVPACGDDDDATGATGDDDTDTTATTATDTTATTSEDTATGGGTGLADADVSCVINSGKSCAQWFVPGQDTTEYKTQCTGSNSQLVEACPSADLVGCCIVTITPVARTGTCYYTSNGKDDATLATECANGGRPGEWQPAGK